MNKKMQVFISSTYTDLIEERQKAVEAILNAGHIPAGMKLFKAGRSQMETIKKWIDESDVYCLLLGGRYGSIEEESGLSYTELEYKYAVSKEKPLFAIVLDDSMIYQKAANDLKGQYIEEGENKPKYERFKKEVGQRIYKIAKNTAEVAGHIYSELYEILNTQSAELTGWVRGTTKVVNAIKEVSSDSQEGMKKDRVDTVVKDGLINDYKEDNSEKLIGLDEYEEHCAAVNQEKVFEEEKQKLLEEVNHRIRKSPQDPQLYVEWAELLVSMDMSNLQRAIPDYLYAIFLNPEYSLAYYDMIQRLTQGQDYVRAMRYAEEACRLFPKEGNAYGCRAYVKCAKTLYKDSIEDCDKAIQLLSHRWFYNTRGRCYRKLDMLNEALEDFAEAHRMDPKYLPAIDNLKSVVGKLGISNVIDMAVGAKAKGDFEKAKKYLEGANLAEPENEYGLQELGGWYYDKRKFYNALEYWKKALKIKTSCKNYYLCAAAYSALNDSKRALEYCSLALEYPDDGYYSLVYKMMDRYNIRKP